MFDERLGRVVKERADVVVAAGKPIAVNGRPLIILDSEINEIGIQIYLIQQGGHVYELYSEQGYWYLTDYFQ